MASWTKRQGEVTSHSRSYGEELQPRISVQIASAIGALESAIGITWHSKRKVSDASLFFIAARRTTKGLLIVVATQKPDTMIKDYYRRWAIETLFGCLKSRGFDLKVTHMTELDCMDKLMGILALAFAWCLIAGHWHYGKLKIYR